MKEKGNFKKRVAPLLIILSGVTWGMNGIFVRGLDGYGISPLEVVFLRALVVSVALPLFFLLTDRQKLRIELRDIWMFVGTGIISMLFFNICYFSTIVMTSLSVAVVLLYTSPVFVMLLARLLFKEKISTKKLISLVITLTGCVLVTGVLENGLSGDVSLKAIIVGLLGGFGYALYSVFGRVALKKYGAYTVTTYSFIFCMLGALPFLKLGDLFGRVAANPGCIPYILMMSLVTSIISYLLYTVGLASVETGRAAILCSTEPVVATLIGVFVYQEMLTPLSAVGMTLVVIGIVLLGFQRRRLPEIIQPAAKTGENAPD